MESDWCSELKCEIEAVNIKDEKKAPFELLCEFLVALNQDEYRRALALCEQILALEPDHETCLEFKMVLTSKIKDNDDEENHDNEFMDSNDENSCDSTSTGSDSGTESTADEEEDNEIDETLSELEKEKILQMNLLVGGLPINCQKKK